MGLYYNGYQVHFSELTIDLEALKEDTWPFHRQLGERVFCIKSTQLHPVWSLEYAMEFLDDEEKRKVLPFFIHTVWFYYNNQYAELADLKRYSPALFDDFGILSKDPGLYERSYACETLRKILKDFDKQVNLEQIEEAYKRSGEAVKHEFVPNGSTEEEYRNRTKENWRSFMDLLHSVISAYRKCVSEKTDLIIDFG